MKLVDSNILIYAAKPEHPDLKAIVTGDDVAVSEITRLEVLGYHLITQEQIDFFNAIFKLVKMIDINQDVINKAIEIRAAKKMKVGDSIIAATALLYSNELITRNVDDFKHLTSLKITNPFDK